MRVHVADVLASRTEGRPVAHAARLRRGPDLGQIGLASGLDHAQQEQARRHPRAFSPASSSTASWWPFRRDAAAGQGQQRRAGELRELSPELRLPGLVGRWP